MSHGVGSRQKKKGQDVEWCREFEAIFQEVDEIKDKIRHTYMEIYLKDFSKSINKSANGLLDQEIEAVKVGPTKFKDEQIPQTMEAPNIIMKVRMVEQG